MQRSTHDIVQGATKRVRRPFIGKIDEKRGLSVDACVVLAEVREQIGNNALSWQN
jgi:hypothetical protein